MRAYSLCVSYYETSLFLKIGIGMALCTTSPLDKALCDTSGIPERYEDSNQMDTSPIPSTHTM
jgi:hypothetical protein